MATVTELRDQLTNLEIPERGIDEPLSAPDLFAKKLTRFQEELYNLHQDSHVYRFLLALCGDGGAGSLKKEILYSKLQSTLAATHFHDLDRLYGDPLALPRLSTEIYQFDPKNETLTQGEWTEIYAKDASYRNRCLLWMRAIMYGTSIMGMKLAAEAACGVECDIFAVADYNDDQRRQPPLGIVNIGQTVSDGEFVIVPRINSLTQAERHRIIAMVDRIRPVDTLVTISLGNTIRTQKFPALVEATSEFSTVLRYVTGRTDVAWPDAGWPASTNLIPNSSAENNTSGWIQYGGATLSRVSNAGQAFRDGSWMFQFVPAGIHQGMTNAVKLAVSPNTTYTFSAYVNVAAGKTFALYEDEFTSGGGFATGSSSAKVGTGTMKRFQFSFTTSSTSAQVLLYVLNEDASNPTYKVEGLQLEAWPYASPYIPTNSVAVFRPRKANEGLWIVPGEEREAPTYAWISRQEAATFLDITNVSSSSEHYGDFSKMQRDLFAPLSFATDDQFFVYADDFAYTQAFAQIGLTIPWQRNDQVLVNNYYPLEYLQAVDLSQFNVSPTHRFWASDEVAAFGTDNLLSGGWSAPAEVTLETSEIRLADSETVFVQWNGGAGTALITQFAYNLSESTRYSYSFWFKGDAGQDYNVSITEYLNSDASDIGIHLTQQDSFVASGETELITGSFDLNSGTHAVNLQVAAQLANSTPFLLSSGEFGEAGQEWVKFDFGRSRPVNYIDFEITQKPIDITVEYSTDDITYFEASPTDGTDYTYGISYVVSEQPWRFWRLYFDKVDARYIRLTFTRRDDPFPFGNTQPFPWSVDVRNFRAVHLMQSSDDFEGDTGTDILGNAYRNVLSTFPAGLAIDGTSLTFWQSQPNPTPIAVEALYFDVSTGTHSVTMSELDAGLGGGGAAMDDYDTLSMSAMESYVGEAGAQVVDEIFIDPVFSGCDMHFYWSTDPQPDWESKLWHPIPVHYKCTRGFHAFPYPVTCRYFKVEFSNLTPVPYNTIDYPQLLPPLYRKFPSWVQNYFAALTPEQLDPFIEESQTITIDPYDLFKIQQDKLATTRDQQVLPTEEEPDTDPNEITDLVDEIINLGDETIQIGQEDQIRFFPPTIWRDDLKNVLDLSRAASRLIWQDEEDVYMVEEVSEILDAPSEQSASDLSAERAQKTQPIMWFPRICRHGYQVVTGPFQSKIAYQVSIREVSFWYRGFYEAGNSEYGESTYGGSFYG